MSKASDYAARVAAAQARPKPCCTPRAGCGERCLAEISGEGDCIMVSNVVSPEELQKLVNWIQENFDIRAEVTARE
jgi:hypothetical protein